MYDRTNEPKCKDPRGHDYSDDVRDVGGNEENPGYVEHGDMATSTVKCRRCGLSRVKYIAVANTATARMRERTVYYWPGEPRKEN